MSDARFATMEARRENRGVVVAAIADALTEDTAERWAERLEPLGVVAAPVRTLDSALTGEQTRARHMVVDLATPQGSIRAVGNPIKVCGMQEEFLAPPLLNEHGLRRETK
jgi:formyl-CoA transferase